MIPGRRQWTSFAALVGLQAQNAFNDNSVRFILLPLGTAVAAHAAGSISDGGGSALAYYQHILSAMLVVPYILFSPLTGWIADRFSRQRVILAAMFLQTLVFAVIAAAAQNHMLWVATSGFFFLALQSTFLSPAKNGIIKELVGSKRLDFANGWIEMTLILGILGGMILGGLWFDARLETLGDPWQAAIGPLWILAAITLIPLGLAFAIERTPPPRPDARFRPNLLWQHFAELKRLLAPRDFRLASLGIMGFWFLGASIQLLIVQIAATSTGGGLGMGMATSWMAAFASGGIAVGAGAVAFIGRKRPVMGLIPLGGILLTGTFILTTLLTPGNLPFHVGLLLLGIFSALYYVPLFAWLQEKAPETQRGRIIASSNILNNVGMVLATLIQAGFVLAGVSPRWQLVFLAAVALVSTAIALPLLGESFWRRMIVPLIRRFYKIRVDGLSNVPAEGGVLLVSNHVSYVDAFILSAASPRPLRFLIFEDYYRMWWSHWFLECVGTIPISRHKAKDALRRAAEAVNQGEVVCIFPEGKLTTDGQIYPFQRGMEIILRIAPAPVQTTAMFGLWGSIFSWYGKGPFRHLPKHTPFPVDVSFGDPLLPPSTAAEAEASVKALYKECKDRH